MTVKAVWHIGRSPSSASKRFPSNAARSLSNVAASIRSSFRRADRSNPENPIPGGEFSGPLVS